MRPVFFLLLAPFVFLPGKKISFEEKYPDAFKEAITWSESIKTGADSICKMYGMDFKKMLPIVLPECARYSIFSDMMECTANEYLYVTLGKDYANFSIGRFQMKPSFIESMEHVVHGNEALSKFSFITDYGKINNEKTIRKTRLDRLESLEWQLKYLCCFYYILEMKCYKKTWSAEEEKIEYYATSYNRGFWHEDKEIKKWKNICSFPNGKIDSLNNYSYGKVALEFLKQEEKTK